MFNNLRQPAGSPRVETISYSEQGYVGSEADHILGMTDNIKSGSIASLNGIVHAYISKTCQSTNNMIIDLFEE